MAEISSTTVDAQKRKSEPLVPRPILWPFILLTSCFAWWQL